MVRAKNWCATDARRSPATKFLWQWWWAPASFLNHPGACTSQTKCKHSSTHAVMIRDACIMWFTHSFNTNFGSAGVASWQMTPKLFLSGLIDDGCCIKQRGGIYQYMSIEAWICIEFEFKNASQFKIRTQNSRIEVDTHKTVASLSTIIWQRIEEAPRNAIAAKEF